MLNPIQQHNLGNAHSARNPSVTTLSITFALISTTKNTICPHCKRPLVLCSRALGLMVGRWSASGDAARGMSGRKRIDLIVQLLGGDGSTNTVYTQRYFCLSSFLSHISHLPITACRVQLLHAIPPVPHPCTIRRFSRSHHSYDDFFT